jgi:hypothetical protein
MPKSKLAELIAAATPAELSELGITPAAQAAAIVEKRQAKKPKRVTTRKVKKVFDASLVHPPVGFRWAYNRLDRPFESMFDGMVYAFDEHEYRLLTLDVAKFLWSQSVISFDPTKPRGVRALALDPFSDQMTEPDESNGFGEPLADPKNAELIDRSTDPNPAGKGAGPGVKTRPAVLSISAASGTNLPRP